MLGGQGGTVCVRLHNRTIAERARRRKIAGRKGYDQAPRDVRNVKIRGIMNAGAVSILLLILAGLLGWAIEPAWTYRRLVRKASEALEKKDCAAAELLFRSALQVLRRALFRRREDVVRATHGLALSLRGQERDDECKRVLQGLLHLLIAARTNPSQQVLLLRKVLLMLAEIHEKQREYEEQIRVLEQARKLLALAGANDQLTGEVLERLGTAQGNAGNLATSQEILEEAVDALRKGGKPAILVSALINLAGTESKLSHYDEALARYGEALQIEEGRPASSPRQISILLSNMAIACRRRGRHAEADAHYQRALALREEVLGKDHKDVAHVLNNYADLLIEMGRLEEAERLLERALRISESAGDEEWLQFTTGTLATLRAAQGRLEEACELFQVSRENAKRLRGERHTVIAESLERHAGVLDRLGRGAEGDKLRQRATEIRQSMQSS
jgi:tetratricopeptide (TPR) repeat protein